MMAAIRIEVAGGRLTSVIRSQLGSNTPAIPLRPLEMMSFPFGLSLSHLLGYINSYYNRRRASCQTARVAMMAAIPAMMKANGAPQS